ncbi:MAG: hypothetical protein HC893_02425 [Chloroflexaceae bacterium]|nr:hypothetical protein [Chloroflexaceae bacterium]
MKLTQERLIYGFDPLCGWCFAFRPTMRAVTATHSDLPITLAYGGLVVGARVEPIAAMRDYLRRGLAQVQAVSGATAGPQFLQWPAGRRYLYQQFGTTLPRYLRSGAPGPQPGLCLCRYAAVYFLWTGSAA